MTMRTIPTHHRYALLLLLGGCIGTSTGNPADGGGDATPGRGVDIGEDNDLGGVATGGEGAFGNSGCLDDPHPIEEGELDTVVEELGFAPREVLDLALGTHEETLRWNPPFNATVAPESGEGTITITVERGDGEVRHVASVPDPDYPGEIGFDCRGRLEVGVIVTLQSAGGALDERLEVTLEARSGLLARAFTRPEPEALGGALTITPTEPGYELAQIDLSMQFTPFGASGQLDVVLEMRTDDAVSAAAVGPGGALASWGATGDCDFGEVPLGLEDEVAGNSGAAVLALLDSVASAELRWDDGTTTVAGIGFSARDGGACALLEPGAWGDGEAGTIALRGTLDIESEDMRLSGSWPVQVRALPGEDGPGTATVTVDWQYVGGDARVGTYGVSGLETAGIEQTSLDLQLEYVPEGDGASLSGSFAVVGFAPVECEPAVEYDEDGNVIGTGGCPGSERMELVSGQLSGAAESPQGDATGG